MEGQQMAGLPTESEGYHKELEGIRAYRYHSTIGRLNCEDITRVEKLSTYIMMTVTIIVSNNDSNNNY